MTRSVKQKKTVKPNKKSAPALRKPLTVPDEFFKGFFDNVLAADLALFSRSDRNAIAANIWELAQSRLPQTHKIRLYNPTVAADGWHSDHTVLDIVNDDMPFLVSSVTSALQVRGITVHHVIHPIFSIVRDAKGKLRNATARGDSTHSDKPLPHESLIHIQFDHCLDAAAMKAIEEEVQNVLNDVRAATSDWVAMRQRMLETIDSAASSKFLKSAAENEEETKAFLRWLDDDNFTYLGYRDIELSQQDGRLTSVKVIGNSGLGILRDKELRVFGGMRVVDKQQTSNLQLYVRRHHLLVVTKTNIHSRVHRPVPLDAIFVRRFNKEGEVLGERLFVGLLTSKSYSQNPDQIPFLRRKVDYVVDQTNFLPTSHNGRAITHILNNYRHDELFQIAEDELLTNCLGILQLQERARVALFVRRDPFERFVTCLIYTPRDRYDSVLRRRYQAYLEKAFNGHAEDWDVQIDESLLARVFVTIRLSAASPRPDLATLESGLRELSRSWSDRLRDSLTVIHGEATALALLKKYAEAFSASYQENIEPAMAVHDIAALEGRRKVTKGQLVIDLFENKTDGKLHLKLSHADRPIDLSEALPLIENMGMRVEYMGGPYEVALKDGTTPFFIHEFVGSSKQKSIVDFKLVKPLFEATFAHLWVRDIENDGFNALSLFAGLNWREIVMLRAFSSYLRQLRIPYRVETMVEAFQRHPHIASNICALFKTRHDPDLKGNRQAQQQVIEQQIQGDLANVDILEEDRIIRRYLNLVQSSLRTNYFQHDANGYAKCYLSIKFDSRAIEFMPLPKPLYEIFVYSMRTEAVHLRGGKVARGGIRWSDRRDDFRAEILGLMKAQMVKNTVIVPVGSKGGFILKQTPAEPEKLQAEGIACYRIMMCGLLDITDNRVGNKIVPPARVVRHDGDDPYLVVAADKGTAKFSDIANGISQEYKFWLDDAFASGGSAGYDHKHMGITARGAWEAVKRHFREMGKDIQTTDFTCVGVGDMSGDVFGNGMLLSKHIRLLCAFDHRHIFCDPTPDAAVSYAERERLFALPRSSWDDYDRKKISKGGGVFPRNAKTIKLSAEMKKAYGITADSLSPTDFIQAVLKMEAELLYFGGIGTYIKASDESHEAVGDRNNEALRIDGKDIRARVVAEGANLGVTQRGRIEYALNGGRINTDAIDNSAGVDTSDHEVNIKILLRKIVDSGKLSLEARNKLLSSMTDDVAALVLSDNYHQTQALSVTEMRSAELLPQHARAIQILEKSGLLNRAVEFLPDANEIADRQRIGKGLTRPELAVLMAYAKLSLFQSLVDSDIPDTPNLQKDLMNYFPPALQKKFPNEIQKHQLSREIVATVITNVVVNRTGSHFVHTMAERTGKPVAEVVRAFILLQEVFGLDDIWHEIEAMDNALPAKLQTQILVGIKQAIGQAGYWLLTNVDEFPSLSVAIASYGKNMRAFGEWLKTTKNPAIQHTKQYKAALIGQGVPDALAEKLAFTSQMRTALDLVRLSEQTGSPLDDIAEVFFNVSQRLGINWLMEQSKQIAAQTPWQREAIVIALDDLVVQQRRLTSGIVAKGNRKGAKATSVQQKLAEWLERNSSNIDRYEALMGEWRSTNAFDVSMLTLAIRQLGLLPL